MPRWNQPGKRRKPKLDYISLNKERTNRLLDLVHEKGEISRLEAQNKLSMTDGVYERITAKALKTHDDEIYYDRNVHLLKSKLFLDKTIRSIFEKLNIPDLDALDEKQYREKAIDCTN